MINGSGLNNSIAGAMSEFSVYLRDSFQYSSPVGLEMLQVQIVRETDSHNILPRITPMQIINGNIQPSKNFVVSLLMNENIYIYIYISLKKYSYLSSLNR